MYTLLVNSNLQDGYIFERDAEELTKNSSIVDSLSVYSQNCYDATWTLALALNESAASEIWLYLILILPANLYFCGSIIIIMPSYWCTRLSCYLS